MYYFGLGRGQAARAWWERALRLDPRSARAREMLFALDRVESKAPAPVAPSARPAFSSRLETAAPSPVPVERPFDVGSTARRFDPKRPAPATGSFLPPDHGAAITGVPASVEEPEFELPIDEPIDDADLEAVASPWDDGPSATEVVTLDASKDDDDAVANDAPAPVLDRDPLFVKPPDEDAIAGALEHLAPNELGEPEPAPLEPEPRFTPSQLPDIAPEVLLREASARMQLDDFEGALRLLERMPPDERLFPEAKRLMDRARERLQERFESKLGSLRVVPQLLIPEQEVMWLSLNHRAGFLLSQIDGNVTYEDLLALSGMPRLDTLRLLVGLLAEGVIGRRYAS